jgi:hypothetical protein
MEEILQERERWQELWDQAKDLERTAAVRRKGTLDYVVGRFKQVKYKRFGDLLKGARAGKVPEEAARLALECDDEVKKMLAEARSCRQEMERLLEEKRRSDTRKVLDPRIDPIPAGQYPKLRDCKTFPLRRCCNYGENESARWERCEFMKYQEGSLITDPRRWQCVAPE